MEFKDYKEHVKRTNPDLGTTTLNSIHMVLGMCSEIYELEEGYDKGDIVNIGEELTDIAWYACNYANVRNIELNSVLKDTVISTTFNRETALSALVRVISELQNYDKKELAYNKKETDFIRNQRESGIDVIIGILNTLYWLAAIDPEISMQNNIDKIKIRYPGKFNDYDATNRDLLKERKELEK